MSGKETCTYPGCDLRAAVACAHTARCGDHMFGQVCEDACCAEIANAFARFLGGVCALAVRLAEGIWPVRLSALEGLTEVYRLFYPSYRARYDEEGAPLGPGDADMWRWYEEHSTPAVESVDPQPPVLRLVSNKSNLVH